MSTRRPIYLPRERWHRTTRMEKRLSRLGEWVSEATEAVVTLFHRIFYRPHI